MSPRFLELALPFLCIHYILDFLERLDKVCNPIPHNRATIALAVSKVAVLPTSVSPGEAGSSCDLPPHSKTEEGNANGAEGKW